MPYYRIPTGPRSSRYIRNAEFFLMQKLAAGYELIGTNLVKPPFVEREEECVIESALGNGFLVLASAKPRRYQITDAGRALVAKA